MRATAAASWLAVCCAERVLGSSKDVALQPEGHIPYYNESSWNQMSTNGLCTSRDRRRATLLSQGGTATHAFFEAACLLGVPAVHWRDSCNLTPEQHSIHRRVTSVYLEAVHCSEDPHDPTKCPLPEMEPASWAGRMTRALSAAYNDTFSMFDTPYNYAHQVTHTAQELRNLDHNFIISHRDPMAWANARKNRRDPLCRENVGVENPFDLVECAHSCKEPRISGCMVSSKDIPIAKLANAFEQSQNIIQRRFPKAHVHRLFDARSSEGEQRGAVDWAKGLEAELEPVLCPNWFLRR